MNRIKKNDEVIVLAGNNKGRRGKVVQVLGDKVVVDGLNKASKTVRPDPQQGEAGGFKEKDMPIHISNVALVDPETGKATRVGFRTLDDGRRVRFYKSSGEVAVSDE